MRYVKAKFYLFKRIGFGQIKTLEINFENKTQLILGTNSSGKSSLIGELTPLPSKSGVFEKGGFKEVEIIHRGKTYLTSSRYLTTLRHSFICDDVELNPSGTAAIQKELVLQHFGLTQETHELLTSSIHFTTFAPSQRRQWFTKLSDVSYTYALDVYKRLTEKQRETQAVIKFTQARLVTESSKLLDTERQTELKNELGLLKELLNNLWISRIEIPRTLDDLKTDFDKYVRLIQVTYRKLTSDTKTHYSDVVSHDFTLNTVLATIAQKRQTFSQLQEDSVKKIETIKRVDTLLKNSEDHLHVHSQTFDQDYLDTSARRDDIESYVDSQMRSEQPIQDFEILKMISADIAAFCLDFKDLPERAFNRSNYIYVTERIEAISSKLRQLLSQIAQREEYVRSEEKRNIEDKVTCPECNTHFTPYFDAIKIKDVKLETVSLNEEKVLLEKEHEELASWVHIAQDFFRHVKYLSTFKQKSPYIENVIENVFDNMRNQGGRDALRQLESVQSHLTVQIEFNDILMKIGAMDEARRRAGQTFESDIQTLTSQRNQEEIDLGALQFDIRSIQSEIVRLDDGIKVMKQFGQSFKGLEDYVKITQQKQSEYVEAIRQKYVSDAIVFIRNEINARESRLSEIDRHIETVDRLTKDAEKLSIEEKVIGKLIKELSPTDGLIAENLHGFIKTFIKQMNAFISQLWSYPNIEILSCQTEEGEEFELDYKFPFVLNGESPVDDISHGSSAAREVIDLAFKIVSMNYLKLIDTPLYLDEFGKSFDPTNRQSSFGLIANLLVHSAIPQLFVISHFEECYGALSNADILILDSKNIVLPSGTTFNQHVKIT